MKKEVYERKELEQEKSLRINKLDIKNGKQECWDVNYRNCNCNGYFSIGF